MIWRKKIKQKEEINYQIVLRDWRQGMNSDIPSKSSLNRHCIETSSMRKTRIESRANFIKNHPIGKHWHYPDLIRKEDFLAFYESNKDSKIGKKIRYYYEGGR